MKKIANGFMIIAVAYFLIHIFVVSPYKEYDGLVFFNVHDRETVDSFLERYDLVRISPIPKGGDIYLFIRLSREYPEKKKDEEVVITVAQKILGINTTLYGTYDIPYRSSNPPAKGIGKPM
jgi:hypothetical protein